MSLIKSFLGITVAVPLAGDVINRIGSVAAIPSGIGKVTQIGIGVGLLGHGTRLFK